MLTFDIDHSGADLAIAGTHEDSGDTPQVHSFTLNVPKGTSGTDISCAVQKKLTDDGRSAYPLAQYQSHKLTEIDTRTDELISAGFTYATKQFSLSIPAQAKIIGTHQVRDNPALTYPINWNTLDDVTTYSIVDSADLDAFYLTAFGTVRAHLDSGTAFKDQIRAAVDTDEVDAVVDTR